MNATSSGSTPYNSTNDPNNFGNQSGIPSPDGLTANQREQVNSYLQSDNSPTQKQVKKL